jgi:hypothetical protein
MNTDAPDKIAMMQRSVQCFVFGLLGLLPVIGIPFAFAAIWVGGKVRASERQFWNAAKPYRVWGVVFAFLGLVSTLLVAAYIVINSLEPGIWYSAD